MFLRPNLLVACTALAFLFSFSSTSYAQQRVKLDATLSGTTLASGTAKYESRGTRRKLSVEVEDARPSIQYRVDIHRAGVLVFRRAMVTNALGGFDLNLDTSLRQVVPGIAAGDRVTVYDTVGKRFILSGAF